MELRPNLNTFENDKDLLVKPDFIIAGAMKSGTTSLHYILKQHSEVFIPDGEVQLFSVDDIEQNPVFFRHLGNAWTNQSYDRFFNQYVDWHRSLYDKAQTHHVLGEDAPSYLSSKKAIDRIKTHVPNVKIIVLLRDPVARVYSHYWHWVRTYRAIYSLEDTIHFQHGNLLQRSFYEDQLRYISKELPDAQVHVEIFEEFINNQRAAISRILEFLELESEDLLSKTSGYKNKSSYPKYLRLALLRNWLFKDLYGRAYQNRVDWMPPAEQLPLFRKFLLRLLR